MAKEQKAIAKLLDDDGVVVDFWRFPIKNTNKILNHVIDLVGKSRLGVSKDSLKNFSSFVIEETEPDGTVIDTVYECDDKEFLDLVKEDYKNYFGYYPSEDKYDSERWSYITDGHKGYKESKMKKLRKPITERFDPPKDWDFDEMLEDYGHSYLNEKYPEYALFDMEDFNNITGYDALEAIRRTFYGGRYGHKNDSFNPNDDFFIYDGYANNLSVPHYAVDEYLKDHIDEEEFFDWCVEEGYFEVEDDE